MKTFTRNQRRSYASRMWKSEAQWLAGMMTGCPYEQEGRDRPCPAHGECGRCWLSAALDAVKREEKEQDARG